VGVKLPAAREQADRCLVKWIPVDPQTAPVFTPPETPAAKPAPNRERVAGTAPVSVETTQPPAEPDHNQVNLESLSRARDQWPKTITLKKAVTFPAVLEGRVVGSVKALPGTQANLILIRNGKAGVEYQGGGAMVDVSDTDLIERVLANRHVRGS
jgi:hypothetical protein